MQYIYQFFMLFCLHSLGDYVLQTDFLAKTKSTNMYHLVVHCALYVLPFAMMFGMDYRILLLFVSHFIIDILKCKNRIPYDIDQLAHLAILAALFLGILDV